MLCVQRFERPLFEPCNTTCRLRSPTTRIRAYSVIQSLCLTTINLHTLHAFLYRSIYIYIHVLYGFWFVSLDRIQTHDSIQELSQTCLRLCPCVNRKSKTFPPILIFPSCPSSSLRPLNLLALPVGPEEELMNPVQTSNC